MSRPLFGLDSDDQDRPPSDFQISSSSESEDSFDIRHAFETREKCPLCLKLKKQFVCQDCLLRGDFYHSKPNILPGAYKDRFVDVKKRYLEIKKKRYELTARCETFTRRRENVSALIDEIQTLEANILMQKQLRDYFRTRILKAREETAIIWKAKDEKELKWPMYRNRLDNMATQCEQKRNYLEQFDEKVEVLKDRLKAVSKARILKLRDQVFPLKDVSRMSGTLTEGANLARSSEWSDEEDDTVRSLMAATSNYWSRPEETIASSTAHSITGSLGPNLPASGDYAAYEMWNKGGSEGAGATGGGVTTRNPANVILAALTYTTQFVNLIAYFLNLRLPHRLSFSEFSLEDVHGGRLNRRVAKLNGNIIHLCTSQGVSPSVLGPRRTILNLLLLFDPQLSDLGRSGPFEMPTQLVKSMEESIERDLVFYEDDSEESDLDWSDSNFPPDWENVQKGTLLDEVSLQEMAAASVYQASFGSVQSDLFASRTSGTGLISSVSSFFKGWSK